MPIDAITPMDIVGSLAPKGFLRAAINFGNPNLARRSPDSGLPTGISVDLSNELAKRLGIRVELVCFESAGKVFEAVRSDIWDIGFLAVDADRAKEIDFSSPYVTLSGSYAVNHGVNLNTNAEVDSEGTRVVVGSGSAYDLYLSRHLTKATIVRAPTSQTVVSTMLAGSYEVGAGVRQQLESDLNDCPTVRLLEGRFMAIHQAIAVQQGRDPGLAYVRKFVDELKASGFIHTALSRHGITGVTIGE